MFPKKVLLKEKNLINYSEMPQRFLGFRLHIIKAQS